MKDIYTGGLIMATITGLFMMLKGIGEKLFAKFKERYLCRVVIYDYDELFYVIENYISANYAVKYRNAEASYESSRRWIEDISNKDKVSNGKSVKYKQEPTFFTIKYRGKRLFFVKEKKTLENAQDFKSAINMHYSIYSLNNRSIIMSFLEQLTDEYNHALNKNFTGIHTSDGYGNWKLVCRMRVKPLDSVVLQAELKESLIKDIHDFRDSRTWYYSANITYKRGYLLYGPPGTGKTTLAKAIASYLSKDIAYINLSSILSDSSLINAFSSIPEESILLIEDVDRVFNGDEAVAEGTKITFSCLLNCLDGVLSRDGIITILTTNHIELLDPALIRTGRIDNQIEIPVITTKEINEYLSVFYSTSISLDADIALPMSKVQEICIQNREDAEEAMRLIKIVAQGSVQLQRA